MKVATVRVLSLLPSVVALVFVNGWDAVRRASLINGRLATAASDIDGFVLFVALLAFAGAGIFGAAIVGRHVSWTALVALASGTLAVTFRGDWSVSAASYALEVAFGAYCWRQDRRYRLPVIAVLLLGLLPGVEGGILAALGLFILSMSRLRSQSLRWSALSGETVQGVFDCLLFVSVGSCIWTDLPEFVSPQAAAAAYVPFILVVSAGLNQGTIRLPEVRERSVEVLPQGSLSEFLATSTASDQLPTWSEVNERVRHSTYLVSGRNGAVGESEHIFLGYKQTRDPNTNQWITTREAVLLPLTLLSEHVHILGRSGTGKTSLGIMPIVVSLIRGYEVRSAERREHAE